MTTRTRSLSQPAFPEFITMMAITMSLVALSIDTMLPAHGIIGVEFAVANINDTQYMVYMLFIGLAFGQILFGPLADGVGRKMSIYIGLAIFVVGTIVSLAAQSFAVMLVGRLLQGIGVAGPRTVSVAIIRDLFSGRQMARVMSFVVSIFVLVPAVAPSLGQAIMVRTGWRSIFWTFLGLALIVLAWFRFRQPETLRPEHRQSLNLKTLIANVGTIVKTRAALGYTIAAGLISGAFVGFLGTAQQIFQQQYALGERFPKLFALLALSVGVSTLINGRIVVRIGMRPLAKRAAILISVVSLALLCASWFWQGQPPLVLTMICLMSMFMFIGFLFGNLNALAMEPLGNIAGTAAAIIGAFTTLISAIIGAAAGALYNDTTFPLAISFAVTGLLTFTTIAITDRDQ